MVVGVRLSGESGGVAKQGVKTGMRKPSASESFEPHPPSKVGERRGFRFFIMLYPATSCRFSIDSII